MRKSFLKDMEQKKARGFFPGWMWYVIDVKQHPMDNKENYFYKVRFAKRLKVWFDKKETPRPSKQLMMSRLETSKKII